MEQTVNIPIQMISVHSTIGEITPLWFRYENTDHSLEKVVIDSVLSHKDTSYNGVREIQYTCRATLGEYSRLFLLKYRLSTCKWVLFKLLD